MSSLAQLRYRSKLALESWKGSGKQVTEYDCPSCKSTVKVRQPEPEDVADKGFWDSLMTCYHCGEIAFVKIFPTGQTEVSAPIPMDES